MIFISLEGLDCSGKTTIGKMLKEKLIQDGYNVIFTREPGGNEISEKIREIILDKKNINMDAWTESLLYIASRRQHLISTIIPALKQKKIVICDRFMDSTSAYQGAGRGISVSELNEIQNQVINFYKPDLTLFFDVNAKLAKKRMKKRNNKQLDRLDLENDLFYENVYQGYLMLWKQDMERIKRIDAGKKINEVYNQCYYEIETALKKISNSEEKK